MKPFQWPFVSRRRYDSVNADRERLRGERDQFAKDRNAFKYAAEQASEKCTDTAIVNDRLTEELATARARLAASMDAESALAQQIHEMAQPVEPTDAELDDITRLTRELDSEKRRADRLQKQYDDAVGLGGGRIEDSRRWQPGYKAPEKTS